MQPVERHYINFNTSKKCIYDSDGAGDIHPCPPPLATLLPAFRLEKSNEIRTSRSIVNVRDKLWVQNDVTWWTSRVEQEKKPVLHLT